MQNVNIAASEEEEEDDDEGFEDGNFGKIDFLEWGEASVSTAPESISSSPWNRSLQDIDNILMRPPSSSQHRGSLNIQHGSSEPFYAPEEEQYYRKRVVRFWDEDEESEASLDAGGLLFAGGIATAGGLSAVGFMVPEGTDMNTEEQFDGSISLLDVFDEEESGDSKSLSMLETGDQEEGEDDDTNSIDNEGDEEKQVRRTLLLAVFGIGFLSLVTYGAKKVMFMLHGNRNEELGAGDIVAGDAVDTAAAHATDIVDIGGHVAEGVASSASQTAAQQATFNASAGSSQTGNTFAAAGVANNPSAGTAAQYVPFRSGVLKRRNLF